MTTETVEAGTFALDVESRTLRGILLPWGERSRPSASNTAPIAFERGTVTIPRDPSVVTVNTDHDRFNPIGRATVLEDREQGVYAEFKIADTPEGDAYLADPGSRRRLSAEIAGIIRDAADRARGIAGRITGAGLVTEGAFASAALFAIGDESVAEVAVEEVGQVTFQPDESGEIEVAATETPSAVLVTAGDNTVRFNPETDTPTDPEGTEQMTASVPNTATASEAVDTTPASANEVFSLITKARFGDQEAEQMLAALSDIKINASGGLTTSGSGVLQPNWVGEVWNGRSYVRKYLSLGTTGTIRAMDEKGFKLTQGTALVAAWNGNKAELPSGTASTALVSSTLRRYGFAADIAREWFDLPGGEEVIAAFMRGVINSYAKITDADALADIVTAAGTPIAPDTYPTDYPDALGMLIQGITAVEDANDTPTFAIVNAAAWSELIYTPRDLVPEFVQFAFATTGEGSADGRLKVVRGDVGIEDTPAVIVGSKAAITFNEIGENPIQLEALDIAKGGVDRAVVGYLQTRRDYDEGIVLIGEADES